MKNGKVKVNARKGNSYWIEDEKEKLSDVLEYEDEREARGILFVYMLILGLCNTCVMTMGPAYVVYRRILDYYPFVSRFEIASWLFPVLMLSSVAGLCVFYVTLTLYVKFHNAINRRKGEYWTTD